MCCTQADMAARTSLAARLARPRSSAQLLARSAAALARHLAKASCAQRRRQRCSHFRSWPLRPQSCMLKPCSPLKYPLIQLQQLILGTEEQDHDWSSVKCERAHGTHMRACVCSTSRRQAANSAGSGLRCRRCTNPAVSRRERSRTPSSACGSSSSG